MFGFFVQSMHCLFFLKMFIFSFFFFMLCSTVFKFLFNFFFLLPFSIVLSSSLFFFLNRSFTTYFFNLVSASLCLYLNIVTMGLCTPVYSISNKYFHNEQFKTESINFLVHTRYVKILYTYSLISHPLFQNILFNTTVWPPTKPPKFSTPFQGNLHNPDWPLTSTSNKTSNPFLGEFTKTPAWPLTSTSNSRPILRGIHKTLPISTTFPTSNTSNSPNYRSKCIWAFFRQISPIYKPFLELGLNS